MSAVFNCTILTGLLIWGLIDPNISKVSIAFASWALGLWTVDLFRILRRSEYKKAREQEPLTQSSRPPGPGWRKWRYSPPKSDQRFEVWAEDWPRTYLKDELYWDGSNELNVFKLWWRPIDENGVGQ